MPGELEAVFVPAPSTPLPPPNVRLVSSAERSSVPVGAIESDPACAVPGEAVAELPSFGPVPM
ncbi:MAG TPA: hypothetical protein VKP14_06695 [Gaiellaceae bacterium]|nr:hypothetical protein [Gaiellaceae bacterium]